MELHIVSGDRRYSVSAEVLMRCCLQYVQDIDFEIINITDGILFEAQSKTINSQLQLPEFMFVGSIQEISADSVRLLLSLVFRNDAYADAGLRLSEFLDQVERLVSKGLAD